MAKKKKTDLELKVEAEMPKEAPVGPVQATPDVSKVYDNARPNNRCVNIIENKTQRVVRRYNDELQPGSTQEQRVAWAKEFVEKNRLKRKDFRYEIPMILE